MTNTIAAEIESWFKDHSDAEFTESPHDSPFSVSDPAPDPRFVLYTSKPATSQQFVRRCFPQDKPGFVGRYGLPSEKDLTWLQNYVGNRQLCFLGDCDPPDLLIFAWLRSHIDISHFGVNDVLLEKLGVLPADNLTIELSESESRGVLLVEKLFPEYRSVIGPKCAALVGRNRKLEVEALVSLGDANGSALTDDLPT